jgi:AAA15 family ATPase/GTPase
MRIKGITIDNFKAFKKVNISCNENFNFIVGENNIGKSTILEAIQLWKSGYDCLVKNNNESFYGENTPRYLSFDSLFFLRLSSINDIFNNNSKKKVSITLVFTHDGAEFSMKITLEKPGSIDTYFRVKFSPVNFNRFKDKIIDLGLKLDNAIFLYQTRPVFHSIKNEPFYNSAQLLKKISLGKSHEVIRNKILRCSTVDNKFIKIEERLNAVFGTAIKIRFKNKSKQDEEFVRITIQEYGKKEVDISLVGSGVLQVIEIFSTLEYISKSEHCLNILMIDEPDSHIHSNLQSALIDELRNDDINQVFLISHNDRLIQKANEGELFYINQASIEKENIRNLPVDSYDSVVSSLAGKLLGLTEEEKEKIIIITEGKTDKKILEKAWVKLNPCQDSPFHFISSGLGLDEEKRSGCADTVKRTIELVSTVSENIKLIGLFDNDREGNEQFKGVNKNIFEPYNIQNTKRKHLEKDIFALLLQVPAFRSDFVTDDDMLQRYFVIEHYFSNVILDEQGMKGKNILGTEIFEIKGNKNNFSQNIDLLEAKEFEHFNILFNNIQELFAPEQIEA